MFYEAGKMKDCQTMTAVDWFENLDNYLLYIFLRQTLKTDLPTTG